MALSNLGIQLAETGQRQAALAAAQEAVAIRRPLAAASPDAYLPDLVSSLSNLGRHLAQVDRPGEAGTAWESAIAELPGPAAQLSLTVEYARYLIAWSDTDGAALLLARTLAAPELPGPAAAAARQLLRAQWRQHPQAVQRAWQAVSHTPLPSWIRLSDDS
jgi:Tetratricopeptide repeat